MRTAQEKAQESLRHRRLTSDRMHSRTAATWQSPHELRSAARAAETLMSLTRRAAQNGQTIAGLVLGTRAPVCWAHYPERDACDPVRGYRYYYHTHPRRPLREHGHFHLFRQRTPDAAVTHLLAVAVDHRGLPLRLFTPNRWVTDEQLQPADHVLRHLRRFRMDRPGRLHVVNAWLRALVTLFWPQVRAVLHARDERIRRGRPNLLDDRRSEVLSAQRVSLPAQIRLIQTRVSPPHSGVLQ